MRHTWGGFLCSIEMCWLSTEEVNLLEQRDQKTRADEVRDNEAIGQNLGFALNELGRHWKVERKKKQI